MRYKKRRRNKLGVFLVDLFGMDLPEKGNRELQQDLISITAAGKRTAVRMYYINKINRILVLGGAGVCLIMLCLLLYAGTAQQKEMKSLKRPGYGEGDRKEALSVNIDGEEIQEFEVSIQQRTYTDSEKEELLKNALTELEKIIPGKNASLDEVRDNLVLPQQLMDRAVTLTWSASPYGIISEDGTILKAEDENGTLVELTGTLICDGKEMIYTSYARVFPPVLSEKDAYLQEIQKEIKDRNEQEQHEEYLSLPNAVNGKKLIWFQSAENPVYTVFLLSLLVITCVWIQMDNEVHKKAEARRTQLLLDYPDLMWKMTMLLGAGLSIKGTFTRIADEYKREQHHRKKQGSTQIRYVYEEVSYTCYEMQSGISEAEAYERFGKRCQLPEYIRIGSILSQNLKKGAKGLTSMLETEAEASLNDRKNNARKLGEKAGTKLLLPMVLMLGVVLAVLMIPAFLSF